MQKNEQKLLVKYCCCSYKRSAHGKNKNEEGKFSEDSPNGAFSESKNPSRFPMPTCIPAVLVSRATVGQKPGGF